MIVTNLFIFVLELILPRSKTKVRTKLSCIQMQDNRFREVHYLLSKKYGQYKNLKGGASIRKVTESFLHALNF